MAQKTSELPTWSSKWAFILAATGSAVGLGNIWRFPYIAGENGGGAFVLVYLGCVLLIGLPLLMSEILIGRRGGHNPAKSMGLLAEICGQSPWWRWIGFLTIVSGLLLLTYYNIIAGWTVAYIFKSPSIVTLPPSEIPALFSALIANPWEQFLWLSVILISLFLVISRGLKDGLELINWIMTPGIIILLSILLIFVCRLDGFQQGIRFILQPDFSALTAHGFLDALGHSFFTLSLASGSMMMYGAYLNKETSIPRSSLTVAGADTAVAIIAGLVIFPIVFSFGLNPNAGTGLAFETLPLAFQKMRYGSLLSMAFFTILFFAAFTSIVSLVEPAVVWVIENFHVTRTTATLINCLLLWIAGTILILSLNYWSDFTPFGLTLFELATYVSANILMPVGGLFIAIFMGSVVHKRIIEQELGWLSTTLSFRLWYFIIRFVVPIAILFIAIRALGLI